MAIFAGLALVVALAVAVSLKERRAAAQDGRGAEVISAFINLSAAPDSRGLDFLARERIQRTNRSARLAHVHPDVLRAYAEALGMEDHGLRLQIADPAQTGPFDYTGVVFDPPARFLTGTAGPWSWARITESADFRASGGLEPAACGQQTPCRAWLLYWDEMTWYYAPIGTQTWETALSESVPDLADVLRNPGERD